jgi:hypothetical protein
MIAEFVVVEVDAPPANWLIIAADTAVTTDDPSG